MSRLWRWRECAHWRRIDARLGEHRTRGMKSKPCVGAQPHDFDAETHKDRNGGRCSFNKAKQ